MNCIKRIIRTLYHRVNGIICEKFYCKSYRIIKDPYSYFSSIYKIKTDTYENIRVQEVYKINLEYIVPCFHERQDILLIENAVITNNSDVVVTNYGVVWDKFYVPNFSKFIPIDSNLYSYNRNEVKIKLNKKRINLNGYVLSLIGVHAHIWAHFLMQFLPKLYYYKEAGVFNEIVNLIIPKITDVQIMQIINNEISSYSNINLIVAESGIDYMCEKLLYIPSASNYPNHGVIGPATSDAVIPQKVIEVLNSNLTHKYSNEKRIEDKIYLVRRDTHRCVTNYAEIEKYFSNLGFSLVEPHILTLEEKVSVFKNAKIIVGPYSSAFMNTIFCNEGTRLLVFSCLQRAQESVYTRLANDCKVLYVTGVDESYGPHSNFHIDLSKIQEAYQYLLKIDYE